VPLDDPEQAEGRFSFRPGVQVVAMGHSTIRRLFGLTKGNAAGLTAGAKNVTLETRLDYT
jgi:hypothetical protein